MAAVQVRFYERPLQLRGMDPSMLVYWWRVELHFLPPCGENRLRF